ncbi:hypothetical protein ACHAWT_009887 [Skeletonema menzelii]
MSQSYNANEHDRCGRCIRHPEVKLRRRKLFVPGTKYVFRWTKKLQYCPCCVVEFVLAVDPEVTGQVGLSRKGRLEITNISTEEYASATVASLSPSRSFGSNNIISKENDDGSQAAGSSVSHKSANCDEQLNSIHSQVDNTTFEQKDDEVVEEAHSLSILEAICNFHEDKSEEVQRPQQLNSPTDVRDIHKQLKPGQHQNQRDSTKPPTKPPVDDVFICKDLMGSISSDSAEDEKPLVCTNQEAVPARIGVEMVNEQKWNSFLVSWQKEKDEMTQAMNALKKENKQLQLLMKCLKKWQKRPPKHEFQNSTAASGSTRSDSQETYMEVIHQQGSIIESLRNEIKCVSTDQLKGMREVVILLQQQVKALEEEKEVNRVIHEQEIDALQQEINSLQQTHAETMCRMVKMALEREQENNKTLLEKIRKIEHARRLQISQRVEIGEKEEYSSQDAEMNEEMTKEERLDLSHKYDSLKSDLDELKSMLSNNEERRKEKKRLKKKKSKGKKRGERKGKNDESDEEDIPLPIDEVVVNEFGQLGFDGKEPDVAGGNNLPSRS